MADYQNKGVNFYDAYEFWASCRNSCDVYPGCAAGRRNDTTWRFSSAVEYNAAPIQHLGSPVEHDSAAVHDDAPAEQFDTAAIQYDAPAGQHHIASIEHDASSEQHHAAAIQYDSSATGSDPAAALFRNNRRNVSLHSWQLRQSEQRKRSPLATYCTSYVQRLCEIAAGALTFPVSYGDLPISSDQQGGHTMAKSPGTKSRRKKSNTTKSRSKRGGAASRTRGRTARARKSTTRRTTTAARRAGAARAKKRANQKALETAFVSPSTLI